MIMRSMIAMITLMLLFARHDVDDTCGCWTLVAILLIIMILMMIMWIMKMMVVTDCNEPNHRWLNKPVCYLFLLIKRKKTPLFWLDSTLM